MTNKCIYNTVKNGKPISSKCETVQLEYWKGKFQLRYANGNIERPVFFDYGLSVINK